MPETAGTFVCYSVGYGQLESGLLTSAMAEKKTEAPAESNV